MGASNKKPSFIADIGLSAIEPVDLALVDGDRQLFTEFLEPFMMALHGQPARIVKELADDLYAYYLADTLAYLTHLLPAPPTPRRTVLGRRVVRPANPAELQAPDPEQMQSNPRQALVDWVGYYRPTGGMLMLEARALFRNLSVAQVFKARNLPIPPDSLANVRFAEEMPSTDYLKNLIVDVFPSNFYWNAQQLVVQVEQFQEAFQQCLCNLAMRYLRVALPAEGDRLAHVARNQGANVADSLMRMQMPIDVYRKRRMEALAIFQDLVAPNIARSQS